MRIPVYVAVAQWVLLLTLGALVVLMFRQLRRQVTITRSPADLGPPVGSPAPGFEYGRLDGGRSEPFRPGEGRAALLAFADPTCPSCEELVTSLNAAHADGELAGVRPLVLISEPPSYLQISDAFARTALPVGRVVADSTLAAYRVSATPLLVAIDTAGAVRAAGSAVSRAQVSSFVRACLLPAPAAGLLPVAPDAGRAHDRDAVTTSLGEEG